MLRGHNGDVQVREYSKGKVALKGKQFMTQYSQGNDRCKQWLIIIPRPAGTVFHTWFYTSRIAQYNEFLPIAQLMLNAWTIVE